MTFITHSIVTYFLLNLRNAINLSRNATNIHHEWTVLWTLKKIVVSRTAVRPTEAKQEHMSDKLRPKCLYTTGRLRRISTCVTTQSLPHYILSVLLWLFSLFFLTVCIAFFFDKFSLDAFKYYLDIWENK